MLALFGAGCSPDGPVSSASVVGASDAAANGTVDGSASGTANRTDNCTARGRWAQPSHITYRIEDRPGPLPAQQWQAALTKACAAWNATGLVALIPAEPETIADVTLGWRRGHHGACEPFGTDTTVAHSGPVRSGTFVHFDAAHKWVVDAAHDRDGYSLYGTALHELGHVLGLGHSTAEDAIMRTGVIRSAPLARSDLCGLQSLYGGGVDALGDLAIEAVGDGARVAVLRGVAMPEASDFAVFDVDGNGGDDVLVWRTDRAGNGQLMIYHFDDANQLLRTTGPFLGVMSPGSRNSFLRSAAGHRVLVTTFASGRSVTRRFDGYGVLIAGDDTLFSAEELATAQRFGNSREGQLSKLGGRVRLVPLGLR